MNVLVKPFWALALLSLCGGAIANSSGALSGTLRPGDNNNGCSNCHGSTPGSTSVAISGPAALLPGATGLFTVTVSGVSNASARVGFTAAVEKKTPQPTFSIGTGEPEAVGDSMTQITHTGTPKLPTNAAASYTFNLAMPSNATLGGNYVMYATGNAGVGASLVGWQHASNFTVNVAPPTPTSLIANQATATGSSIALSWSGTQGEHFRVLRKTGSFPSSASDAGATLVYEGAAASSTATGLSVGTRYFFAVFGKSPTSAFYSSAAAQASAATLPANPSTMTAMAQSSSDIALSWSGSSGQYRVLAKQGSFPASPTDATARLVYSGSATTAMDSDLAAGTAYFYRVWSQVSGVAVYSSGSAQASATTAEQPTDRYINAQTGNDQAGANDCAAAASPCRTITRAMAAAGGGDRLFVAPGTYNVALGEVFPIAFKSGVQLRATGSAAQTIIDGTGDTVQKRLLLIESNNGSQTLLQGFTLRNAVNLDAGAIGGALNIAYGSGTTTVRGNVFENNEARGTSADDTGGVTQFAWGGAIMVFSATVRIENNVFLDNRARGGNGPVTPNTPINGGYGASADAGAIYFAGSGRIINNTFVGNRAIGGNGPVGSDGTGVAGPGRVGALYVSGPAAVRNNLFLANEAVAGVGTAVDDTRVGALSAPQADLSHNLLFANRVNGTISSDDDLGSAAVLADPKLIDAPTDLRLRLSSPAKAAGSVQDAPSDDFYAEIRPQPPSIGAFEAVAIAQTISVGVAPTLTVGGSAMLSLNGGDSGQPVVLSSQTPAVCSVSGVTVTGLAAGQCSVAANQAGDADHSAAPQVLVPISVLAAPNATLSLSLTGSGRVQSSPSGLDCTASCAVSFVQGTTVSLTAIPAAGWIFSGWSDACSGNGGCSVSMTTARNVSATFVPDPLSSTWVFANSFE